MTYELGHFVSAVPLEILAIVVFIFSVPPSIALLFNPSVRDYIDRSITGPRPRKVMSAIFAINLFSHLCSPLYFGFFP